MDDPRIGFVGLGLMGRAMVECLQKNGFELTVLGHRDRSGLDEALAQGATEAASGRALAEESDIVMLCMGTSDQVEARIYGPDGILAGARAGQVVIDFGTSLPASTLKIGADLAKKGAVYLDAPLGRTPAQAREGRLNIMCAGERAAYDRVRPVLDVLGENVFHLGKLGNGHTIKLINNFFAMTTACAMSEAFAMADAAGIEREALYGVMSAGPLKSGMMDFIRAYAVEGRIDLAFSVANAAKDVGYYRRMTEDLGRDSPISGAADAALRAARDGGAGDLMVPQMTDWIATHSKKGQT
ncbi:6-phosphogluconate dehydrogenase [Rhodovulum sulfidophilum]|uniref:NAD(P)-dependent oxidoreductase n=1 Tax=Rhodovulum visakhapatnamense TaxID=364297 RepID=A0ABS1RIV1_9RHOB|nr:NAD(P)-dependent oxidoreductase [Rhodovulum visakhapatnamense]MBL3571228.1 NAD(P)-dependent oxidoreductase [Rhodovulum visakhapatnamense]MBL3579089.1 NAD(P)-dependent oxidoreductase [Rhodovulum visakhapatnamense]OLS45078.1 6-phosphogluconate dehydrogenase [Rhodovulum sulfidophilum]